MKKDKKSELNKKVKPSGVAEKSTVQKKKVKPAKPSVEKLEKITKEVKANSDNVSVKKKAPQQEKGIVAPIKTPVEIAEKQAKKIAKKLAQKLKKQQGKEKATTEPKAKATDAKNATKTDQVKVQKKSPKAPKLQDKATTTAIIKNEKKQKKKELRAQAKTTEKQVREPATEEATVFVGNLPVNTKRVQILKLFHDYMPVKLIRLRTAAGHVIFKHKHRKAAGTLNAYVVLKDAETAERALQLNGIEFKEQHLRVTRSTVKQTENDPKRTVFVGNLKYSATEEKLREIFSSCGEIDYIRCLRDGEKGCNGVAYVCFKSPEAVGLALELKETMLDERPIHVERYAVKKLGAKQSRDAENANAKKQESGAKRRMDKKRQNQDDKKESASSDKKKKGEFRGVKVDGQKKKQKKTKGNNQMQHLAKKIAPRAV